MTDVFLVMAEGTPHSVYSSDFAARIACAELAASREPPPMLSVIYTVTKVSFVDTVQSGPVGEVLDEIVFTKRRDSANNWVLRADELDLELLCKPHNVHYLHLGLDISFWLKSKIEQVYARREHIVRFVPDFEDDISIRFKRYCQD